MAPKLRIKVYEPRYLGVGDDVVATQSLPTPRPAPARRAAPHASPPRVTPRTPCVVVAGRPNTCAALAIGLLIGLLCGLAMLGMVVRRPGYGFTPVRFHQLALPRA